MRHHGQRACRGPCTASPCDRRPGQLGTRRCQNWLRQGTRREDIPSVPFRSRDTAASCLRERRCLEARIMTPTPQTAFPLATYRLQLHRGFTFADAVRTVPYLQGLGITDCYLSPISKAAPGSDHGYDVIDPVVVNPELGSEQEFEEFVRTVRAHGMGLVLDVVPNHMGIGKT